MGSWGAAIFGRETIPNPEKSGDESRVRAAFRVAKTMMDCNQAGSGEAFFIVAALAAQKSDKKVKK